MWPVLFLSVAAGAVYFFVFHESELAVRTEAGRYVSPIPGTFVHREVEQVEVEGRQLALTIAGPNGESSPAVFGLIGA